MWACVAAVVVAVSAAVSLRGRTERDADLHALFDGPETHHPAATVARYPQVTYDTTRYRDVPSDAVALADNDPTGDPRSVLRLVGKTVYEEPVLPEFLTFLKEYDIIFYGLILMVIMILAPHGIFRPLSDSAARFVKRSTGKGAEVEG